MGLTANRFELVNTFYVAFDEDRDEVTAVIVRAMALLADAGRAVPVDAPDEEEGREPDHLMDIHEVLRGQSKLRTQPVLRRLADLNPGEYAKWSFRDLAAALAEDEIRLVKIRGNMFVRAVDVADALTERDEEDDE